MKSILNEILKTIARILINCIQMAPMFTDASHRVAFIRMALAVELFLSYTLKAFGELECDA